MGVYEDMANDAGYAYGTEENKLFAMNIEQQDMEEAFRQAKIEQYREILYRKFND